MAFYKPASLLDTNITCHGKKSVSPPLRKPLARTFLHSVQWQENTALPHGFASIFPENPRVTLSVTLGSKTSGFCSPQQAVFLKAEPYVCFNSIIRLGQVDITI